MKEMFISFLEWFFGDIPIDAGIFICIVAILFLLPVIVVIYMVRNRDKEPDKKAKDD